MNENTNDVSKNGENSDSANENTAAKVPSEKKKKERDRELPDWMLDKTTVNELIFSRMLLGQHPMKCIKGVFYDYDGVVDENELGNEIYNILMKAVWFGLPKKVSNIIDCCCSE